MKLIKIFFILLTLTIGIQSWTKADDIRDFEIEGISVGDSLTTIMSEQEIKQNTLDYFNDIRKYYIVGMVNNLNQYDQLEFYLKTNDKNYEIKSILAGIKINDIDLCLEKKKIVVDDLDKIFVDIKKITGKKKNRS